MFAVLAVLIAIIVVVGVAVLSWTSWRANQDEAADDLRSLAKLFDTSVPLRTNEPVTPIPTWSFASGAWAPMVTPNPDHTVPEREAQTYRLRVVTWNVWFEQHQFEARTAALLEQLHASDADVIALQEVTGPLMARLVRCEWIQSGYVMSDNEECTTMHGYGVLVMVRSRLASTLRFGLKKLPSRMERRLVIATFDLGLKAGAVRIGSTHLESLRSADIRVQQLQEVVPIICCPADSLMSPLAQPFGLGVFMGDCNFDPLRVDSEPAERVLQSAGMADVWCLVHGNVDDLHAEPVSWTQPQTKVKRAKRIDRIMGSLQDHQWRAVDVKRLGVAPLPTPCPVCSKKGTACRISDHVGLCATFEWAAS